MPGKQLIVVTSGLGKSQRKVIIEVDRHYLVKPQNTRKLKHRDRECILLDVIPVSESRSDSVAKVRFLDNNRQGRVDLSDLVPLDDLYEDEYLEEQ